MNSFLLVQAGFRPFSVDDINTAASQVVGVLAPGADWGLGPPVSPPQAATQPPVMTSGGS